MLPEASLGLCLRTDLGFDECQHEDRGAGFQRGDEVQAGRELAGAGLEPADHVGRDEAGEVADGVDQGDAAGGGGAGEEGGGQRPEDREGGEDADGGDGEGDHGEHRAVQPHAGEDQAGGGHQGG